jgi:hypothetical protein
MVALEPRTLELVRRHRRYLMQRNHPGIATAGIGVAAVHPAVLADAILERLGEVMHQRALVTSRATQWPSLAYARASPTLRAQ